MAYETVDTETCYGTRLNTCTGYPNNAISDWMATGNWFSAPNSPPYRVNFYTNTYYRVYKCTNYLGIFHIQDGDQVLDSGACCIHLYDYYIESVGDPPVHYYYARFQINYTAQTTGDNVYVNSGTGFDVCWGLSSDCPVQTWTKAYSVLNSGGTIHILNSGADFSGETVTLNKSFSVDLNGATGYFYMPKAL
jgi:hypothetical protein